MITSPQEIEQTAMAIANWIIYNGRPFTLPTDQQGRVYLCVLTEEQMAKLNAPDVPIEKELKNKKQS